MEIVIGKLLPYLVLGTLAVLLVVAAGGWAFDVPFRAYRAGFTPIGRRFMRGPAR